MFLGIGLAYLAVYSGALAAFGSLTDRAVGGCVVLVGVLVFVYMAIVKPGGTLTVTYERWRSSPTEPPAAPNTAGADTMACPRCAETLKRAARMCRFCQLDLTKPPAAG